MTSYKFVQLHPQDTCVVALEHIPQGSTLSVGEGLSITTRQAIPPGHKISLCSTDEGQPVLKYGWSIGNASQAISPGDHIHSHNLRCEHKVDLEALATDTPPRPASCWANLSRLCPSRRKSRYAELYCGHLHRELLGFGIAASGTAIRIRGRPSRLSQRRWCDCVSA